MNRLGQPVFIYSQNAALRMLFRLRGDWDRMKRADEFLDLTDPGRQQQPEDYALKFQDGSKELNDVMISEARSLLEENITRNPAPPILLFTASLVAGLARLVPDDGLLDTLDRAVLEVERFAGHRWTTYRLSVLHLAAEIAYIRGTAMPRDDHGIITAATTVIDPITNISTSHARAMAYEIAGDIDRAEMAYGQALLDCRERRLRPESVWTSLDYARFLVKHRPGVSDMVLRKVVTEGSAVASALGLNPIVTRLASILTAADRQTTANHADCFGLSAREVEIASLVVGGLSNRDISKWLVITLNTVQTHVSNILAKTGASDRTEAALLIEGIAVPPENRG